VIRPTTDAELKAKLTGARFGGVSRRGKYLLFTLRRRAGRESFPLLVHLGMTGRLFLQEAHVPLPRHAAVSLQFDRHRLVFEDTRYFGRFTLDTSGLAALGPEPLADEFTPEAFARELRRSSQAIKVKLLDQALVAGVGNIYASEALFRARVSPRVAARRLRLDQVERLHRAVRTVLDEAIRFGSTTPLNWSGRGRRDGLFYYGLAENAPERYAERLQVYDRAGKPCSRCGTPIRRIVQATRSTFYCPNCVRAGD
jgi:formamidopyrimidine-DNA glycosylase